MISIKKSLTTSPPASVHGEIAEYACKCCGNNMYFEITCGIQARLKPIYKLGHAG